MSSGKGEDYKCRNILLIGGREGQKIAVSSGRGKKLHVRICFGWEG